MFSNACSHTAIDPVLPARGIDVLCIDQSPDAGENYTTVIGQQLSAMGISHKITGGAFPGECVHRLQSRVVWAGTLIKYVVSLELTITEDGRTLGDASYFVGQAYRTPKRLGSAASKAKPLLEALLAEYGTSKK
jgi:hypothetical protein